MSNATIVTVRAVDDAISPRPPLGGGSLVTPLLVLLAIPAAERVPGAPELRVQVTAEDGTTQDIGVREVGVRPLAGPDAALVGLILEEPAAARPDDVPGLAAAPVDDAEALAAAAWEHLTGDRARGADGEPADAVGDQEDRRRPGGPGRWGDGDDHLSLICRLFGIGCPRTVLD